MEFVISEITFVHIKQSRDKHTSTVSLVLDPFTCGSDRGSGCGSDSVNVNNSVSYSVGVNASVSDGVSVSVSGSDSFKSNRSEF